MSVICNREDVLDLYRAAGERGWVLPCICTENLTTTEAVLTAAEEFRQANELERLPIIVAMTCRYGHRSQAANYTHTRRWDTGLKLFTESVKVLAAENGPFARLDVMIHLDHIQYDLDTAVLEGSLDDYASIMYDASTLPLEENIRRTADFVRRRGAEIVIEGACDEIVDAVGSVRNALTTPENAGRFLSRTGVDLVVCNLGTEHRATGKDLHYHGEVSRAIREAVGARIVLHGTSSVPNDQVAHLYEDGVCKVNVWTALERDSTPRLFDQMVRNARRLADKATVGRLVEDGLLTAKANADEPVDIAHFTTLYRQDIVFEQMKGYVRDYLRQWYPMAKAET